MMENLDERGRVPGPIATIDYISSLFLRDHKAQSLRDLSLQLI